MIDSVGYAVGVGLPKCMKVEYAVSCRWLSLVWIVPNYS